MLLVGIVLGGFGGFVCFYGWEEGRMAALPLTPLADLEKRAVGESPLVRVAGRAHSEPPFPGPGGAALALQWVNITHRGAHGASTDYDQALPEFFHLRGDDGTDLHVRVAALEPGLMFGAHGFKLVDLPTAEALQILAEQVSPLFRKVRYTTEERSELLVYSVPQDARVTVVGKLVWSTNSTLSLRAKAISELPRSTLDKELARRSLIHESGGAVLLLIGVVVILKGWWKWRKDSLPRFSPAP